MYAWKVFRSGSGWNSTRKSRSLRAGLEVLPDSRPEDVEPTDPVDPAQLLDLCPMLVDVGGHTVSYGRCKCRHVRADQSGLTGELALGLQQKETPTILIDDRHSQMIAWLKAPGPAG